MTSSPCYQHLAHKWYCLYVGSSVNTCKWFFSPPVALSIVFSVHRLSVGSFESHNDNKLKRNLNCDCFIKLFLRSGRNFLLFFFFYLLGQKHMRRPGSVNRSISMTLEPTLSQDSHEDSGQYCITFCIIIVLYVSKKKFEVGFWWVWRGSSPVNNTCWH